MTRLPLTTTGLALAAACATVIPPAEPPPPSDLYVPGSFDQNWQGVVEFFADSRIPIQTIDRSSGLIISNRFQLSPELVERWVDCGKASSGGSTIARLRAVNNFPTILADFNVLIRQRGDSTAVRVNLGMTGTARSPGGIVDLRCVTNGGFEEALHQYLLRANRTDEGKKV